MPVCAGDLSAQMSADAELLSRLMEARQSADAIAIEQRHGRHAQLGAASGEFSRCGRAFQKTEGGAGVELRVHFAVCSPTIMARILCPKMGLGPFDHFDFRGWEDVCGVSEFGIRVV